MHERPRWRGDLITIAGIAALFGAVYLLPPDTSLAEVKRTGTLGVCVPTLYPPLVTGKPDTPGFDVEFVEAVARRLGVKTVVSANAAMARDFNPRDWHITRGQCQIVAGGVVASDATRSFLDTTPPHLETGWAIVAAKIPARLNGVKVGVYTGLAGLDRLGLSRLLRTANARIEIMPSAEVLSDALRAGRVDAGVSEALMARQIAGDLHLHVAWMPAPLARYPIAFGLWKGDLTLKRRLAAVIGDLERGGLTRALMERYRIAPIEGTVQFD